MSRPLKHGLDYFPHDTDAVNDDKIQSLMALYGTEGYAFYFILLERIFRTENARITIGKPAIKHGLSKVIGISIEKFEQILSTALELSCFNQELYNSEQVITSNGVQKRMSKVTELRERERERKAHKEREIHKDKYKEKEKAKTGKTHGKPTENFIIPTIQEVTAYCLERKNGINPKKWTDFYASKGWMIGKNKMKDWKAAVRTWENPDTEKEQAQYKATVERIKLKEAERDRRLADATG